MYNMRGLVLNKYLICCLVFITIEQLIAASTTIWLAYVGKAIVSHGNVYLYLALLLIACCIGFVPWIIAMVMLEKAKFNMKQNYILFFIRNHHGLTTLTNRQDLRNDKEAWAIAESDVVIQDLLDFCLNACTAALYFTLSIAAIAFVTNSIVVLAHGCAFALIIIFVSLNKKNLRSATEQFQDAAVSTRKNLLRTWDNILVGNKYNLNNWNKSYFSSLAKLQSKAVRLVAIRETVSALPVLIAMLPVGGVILLLYHQNYQDIVYLAALTTTLPKQVQTIQNMYGFTRILATWHSIKIRLAKLIESIDLGFVHSPYTAEQYINWNGIRISSGVELSINSIDDLLNFINKHPHSRITIRGSNGAGKSTILSMLKERLQNNAIYIPAAHVLCFTSTDNAHLSQGQKKILELQEIIKNNDSYVLLLDEWDANLDTDNALLFSAELDLLTKNLCLIEVRHKS